MTFVHLVMVFYFCCFLIFSAYHPHFRVSNKTFLKKSMMLEERGLSLWFRGGVHILHKKRENHFHDSSAVYGPYFRSIWKRDYVTDELATVDPHYVAVSSSSKMAK